MMKIIQEGGLINTHLIGNKGTQDEHHTGIRINQTGIRINQTLKSPFLNKKILF